MKIKRIIFVILSIILLTIMLSKGAYATIVTKNTDKLYIGIDEIRTNDTPNFGYAIGDPNFGGSKLWNFLEYQSNGTDLKANGHKNIYCLKAEVGFSDVRRSATYDEYYDMKSEKTDIKNKNSILASIVDGTVPYGTSSVSKYNSLLALGDMLYLLNNDENAKMEFLENAGIYPEAYDKYMTRDEIMAVQQAAIWYFTNYGDTSKDFDKTDDTHWLNYTTDRSSYESLANYQHSTPDGDTDREGFQKQAQAEILYNYLINTAKSKANSYASITNSNAPAALTTTTLNYEEVGANYIIGPINFSRNTGNPVDYEIDFIVKNGGTATTEYTLLNSEKNPVSAGTKVKDLVGQNFYISMPVETTTSVSIETTVRYTNSKLTLWTAQNNSGNDTQPLLIPEKKPESVSASLNVTPTPKKFDLSLRKYITKVNGTDVETRVPVIDRSTLQSGTTATYKHRKDPVVVKTGNTIIYNIRIYNEGEKAGRATKIVDQLPKGIRFDSVVSGNFVQEAYNTTTNTLTLKRKDGNNTNLPAYTGTSDPASEIIQIQCTVTAEATENRQVLTNLAWISEEVDGELNKTITNQRGLDRDSEPSTITTKTQEQLVTVDNGYIGNDSNNGKTLSNPDSYFEGQQDDDDFEKVVLNSAVGTYDLHLIKVDEKDNTKKLAGAQFEITLADGTKNTYTTDANGLLKIENINVNKTGTDTITIKETTAPNGYVKKIDTIVVTVQKQIVGGEFKVSVTDIKNSDGSQVPAGTTHTVEGNTIKVTVPNTPLEGNYKLQLVKVDEKDSTKKLAGAQFTITLPSGESKTVTTDANGLADAGAINIAGTGIDTITVTEITAPTGYKKILNSLQVEVTKIVNGDKYVASNATLKNVQTAETSEAQSTINLNGDTITVTVPNKEKIFDLSLRKYITKVNNVDVPTRTPVIDNSTLQSGTTATYKHRKDPVTVETNQTVIYNIRIYNEGEKAGRATKVVDQLPKGIRFDRVIGDGNFEVESYVESTNTLTLKRKDGNVTDLAAYNPSSNPASEVIQIQCTVTAEATENRQVLTNLAWISEEYDSELNRTIISNKNEDRDSEPSTITTKTQDQLVTTDDGYTGNDSNNGKTLSDANSYFEGQQDDDDFEKVVINSAVGTYDLHLIKVDEKDNTKKLAGAQFEITLADGTKNTYTTDANGLLKIENINVNGTGTDTITIKETTVPNGYVKKIDTIVVTVQKQIVGGEFKVSVTDIKNSDGSQVPAGTTHTVEGNTIKVTVPNTPLEGNYKLQLVKVDEKDSTKKLAGAQFTVTLPSGESKTVTTDANGLADVGAINIAGTGTDTITVTEITAPTGYKKILNSLQVEVTKIVNGDKYVASNATLKNVQTAETSEAQSTINLNGDTITVTVPNKEKIFDLSLRKYITKANDVEVPTRTPVIDKSTLQSGTTATYKHRKDPVPVGTNQTVIYNIRIYNEGEKAGRATKVIDQLPKGIRFDRVIGDGNFEIESYVETTNTLTLKRKDGNVTDLAAYTGASDPASETIQIQCTVTAEATENRQVLTNLAWISEEYDSELNRTIISNKNEDRDSEPSTITTKTQDQLVTTDDGYTGNDSNNGKTLNDSNSYFEGQQDDDDFEKIVIEPKIPADLKLVKRIVEVNGVKVPERIEKVDVSKLNTRNDDGEIVETTAEYKLNKDPVEVKKGDIVTYTFRVYNEGMIDAYASEITEDIPEGLEYLSEETTKDRKDELTDAEKEAIQFNKDNLWGEVVEVKDGETTRRQISTTYLSKNNETKTHKTLIKAFGENDGTKTEKDLDYEEVSVKFKVVSEAVRDTIIRNEAAITEETDEDGKEVEDRDSKTDIWKKYEDDEDYDNIILKQFDLALRKFIIAVSKDETIEDSEYLKNEDGSYKRAPDVDTSKLNTIDESSEDKKMITTATYNHTKEPVLVQKNDIVVYMLRAYNEGDYDGYAAEIKDHLPPYLEFVDSKFNDDYGWSVSEDGKTVTTTYLKDLKIKKSEFVTETQETGRYKLDYQEVPIMCKVVDSAPSNEKITNIADITKYEDEDNNPVEDRDSKENDVTIPEDLPGYNDDKTGEYIPGQQDDDDFEKVIVKKFDLALRKWVTQAIVTDSKGTTVTNTGHQPYDDPEQVVKVELNRKKINEVTVKFRYSIRVINEGEIEGYAKEVTDYIPEGLRFVASDNPGWTDEGNNVISTTLLENTLLQPGEFADVEVVLTWINNANNMGVKTNTAEISKDYNEYGVPDIDSTPDNKVPGEDDIDDAPVMLSTATGRAKTYFVLGITVLVVLAGGVTMIKKYVV